MAVQQINLEELPSKGKGYNVDYIEVRGLTNEEVVKLSTVDMNNIESVLEDMFQDIVKNIDFGEIFFMDKYFLFLKVRELTFPSSDYVVPYKCDNCQNNNRFTVDFIEDINVNHLNDDINKKVNVKLVKQGEEEYEKELNMRPIKIKDFDRKLENLDNPDPDTIRIASTITNLNLEDSYSLIKGVDVPGIGKLDQKNLIKILSTYQNFYNYGLSTVFSKQCTSCRRLLQVPFVFIFINFIPTL